jgi:hypothetical protein
MLSPCRYLQADQFADARLLKPYPSCGDWDNRYIGVLAATAQNAVLVSTPQPRQLQFSFIEPR